MRTPLLIILAALLLRIAGWAGPQLAVQTEISSADCGAGDFEIRLFHLAKDNGISDVYMIERALAIVSSVTDPRVLDASLRKMIACSSNHVKILDVISALLARLVQLEHSGGADVLVRCLLDDAVSTDGELSEMLADAVIATRSTSRALLISHEPDEEAHYLLAEMDRIDGDPSR